MGCINGLAPLALMEMWHQGPCGPHSDKDMTCTQISDFRCLQAPQKPWCFFVPQTSPPVWLNLQIWDAAGGIWSCPAEPTVPVLTCLPAPGPSHQTASVATWEGRDGQTGLNPKEDQAQGGFSPPKQGPRNGICWSFLTSRSAAGSGLSGCQPPAS